MYAIYYSDKHTDGRLCLFGVVKSESFAREIAPIFSFELRWDRYQLRYCRSPYLEGSIPNFAVYTFSNPRNLTYFGFFKIRAGASRLLDHLAHAYPGVRFCIRDMSVTYELRASHLDKKQALF